MPIRRHPIAMTRPATSLASLPIDLALVTRLRATYELVRMREERLAEIFYAKLFAVAPHLRPLFRSDLKSQAEKLMAALDAVVRNLERPEENAALLADMGRRHAGYGAKPEHYPLVTDLLVDSIGELLGPSATQGPLEEWRLALTLVSDQMIAAASRDTPGEGVAARRP